MWVKSKRWREKERGKEREKERKTDGNNNGQATHGARKPPGPIKYKPECFIEMLGLGLIL